MASSCRELSSVNLTSPPEVKTGFCLKSSLEAFREKGGPCLGNQKESTSPCNICILVDRVRPSAMSAGSVLWGWEQTILEEKLRRAGIPASEVSFESISRTVAAPTESDFNLCRERLNAVNPVVIVALDETALRFTTGKSSIWKWHLSPLDFRPGTSDKQSCGKTGSSISEGRSDNRTRKVIPSFHPDQIRKQPELGLYLELALIRSREESSSREFSRKPQRFLLNPRIEETFRILEQLRGEPHLSVDIETGRGQINTMGFAWSASDAIAINVLPDVYGPANYYKVWEAIRKLLEGPARKIYQNALYEIMCFSRYGIRTDVWHDTMLAQKFLWPELDKGLDNVGRLYTREKFWKDDGRSATATTDKKEKKDWGNIRDWPAHYSYNCKDTSNTFEACFSQREDLARRDKLELFDDYLMRLYPSVAEMCLRGLPLSSVSRDKLIGEYESKVAEDSKRLSKEINPNSPKQKLKLFKDKGYAIPKSRGAGNVWRESTDELSLKKMRLKHPEDPDIPLLLEISETQKALSSYLRVETNPFTKCIHFSMDTHGTETGRFACRKDPWDQGFNAQTIPGYAKKMIEWPEDSGRTFIQCDLKQAESRFVAYDTADTNLMAALEDPSRDIHSEVAHQIINTLGIDVSKVSKEEFKQKWRQLGKKSGHGANYAMQAPTFIENCLKEMDLVLTKKEAEAILEAYHALFPGIKRGHANIEKTLWAERRLSNPFGRERYFYSRMDASTFREAYAYRAQSTIPDVTNSLMLALWAARAEGKLDFWFHLQVHDSIVVSALRSDVDPIAEFMLDYKSWQKPLALAGGTLLIPSDVEVGPNLKELTTWKKAT